MVYLADEDFNMTIKVGDKFMTAHEVISTDNDFFDLAGINILVSSTDKPFAEKKFDYPCKISRHESFRKL